MCRKLLYLMAFVLLLGMFSASALATDYYIATNGDDSNPGTIAQPWATISFATCGGSYKCPSATPNPNKLVAGDTLYIRGGTYNEYNIKIANSGTAGNPIIIKAYPGETVVIDGGFEGTLNGFNPVFDIDDVDYITLDSLNIRRGSKAGILIGYNAFTSYITIQNCEISEIRVDDNTGAVFVATGNSNVVIRNNKLHTETTTRGAGVEIFRGGNNIVIEDNEIYNTTIGVHYKHGVTGSSNSPIIRNNTVHDIVGYGIKIATDNAVVENNVIYNTGDHGIRIYHEDTGWEGVGSFNANIIHNTIVDCYGGIMLYQPGAFTDRGARYTVVRDNLLHNSSESSLGSLTIWPYGSGSHYTTSNYNLVYDPDTTSVFREYGNLYDLTGWRTTTGLDINSIQLEPIFQDYANKDFTLSPGSPGKNAASDGTNMGAAISSTPQPPGQASNPSPADSATDVLVDADLSWTAGSGSTSSDVYFGTSNPGTFQGNQTATTFYPGTMTNDTAYYWRIDEVNAQGTTTGTVWSFTTEAVASPPGQASNPSPANSATGVSVTTDLSWTAGSGATSHDVYFGTSSPGASQGNQVATTFDTGTMAESTTYYWRIDAVNAQGTTTGSIWSFTTAAASSQLVITNLWVANSKAYEVVDGGLAVGAVQCIDRSYTFSSVPASLVGKTYIKTAMDDKQTTGSNFLSFDTNQDVAVYVAHDDRITPKPTWLQSFADTGDDLFMSYGETFSLYRKDYPQGTVMLGANSGQSSATAMYTVVIVGQGAPSPPDQATNPSPSNAATDVSINADLSWTADPNATSHDVYFGTSSPGSFQGNQTATTFDPGTMTNDTTYYWRIDEVNAGGTTTGTVWSFTTIVAAPTTASSPNPTNSATNVSVTTDLSWSAGSGATSHDVYFGTSSPGSFQGNQTATTFDTGTMANDATYFWRIDEVNAGGTTTGSVWSFTTIVAAPSAASSPSPADSATDISITTDLSWSAGSGATSHDVYFGTSSPGSFQGNQTATTFDTGTMANDTTYFWRINEINAGGTTTGTVWSFTTIVAAPGVAGNPSPANSATSVSITADLSWSAGSGATSRDVYFGTSSPGSFQGNQTATTFDTGMMSNSTTYFWRIDEINAGGTTTGAVWSFTTIVMAPSTASSPGPADSATDVNTTADLNWTAGSGATSHDVYFGTSSPGAFQGNQAATTFDTGTMNNNTTYFWRIDGVNAGGTTTGTVWDFTTAVASGPVTEEFGDATNTDYPGTIEDTYANAGDPTGTRSTVNQLKTYTWPVDTTANLIIIKWDLSDLPTDSVIVEATLYLYQDTTGGDTAYDMGVHKIINVNPVISTCTWNTYDGTNSWTGGSDGGQSDIAAAEDTPAVNNTINEYKTWSVTDMVADWVATPASNYGMLVNADDVASADSHRLFASTEAVDVSTRPKLIITYTTDGQATNPVPADSATDVSVTAGLSWTAGDYADTHDVYLGTDVNAVADANNSSAEFMANVDVNNYDPGTLDYSTTYYWAIDEVNDVTVTTWSGDVWSFTTEAQQPPAQATNPNPVDSATDVSITATLSWTAGIGSTSSDVYFGTSSPGTFQGNQTATTFDPGTMANDTTYYWRIDEVNAAGTTTGVVWSFTTEAAGGGPDAFLQDSGTNGIVSMEAENYDLYTQQGTHDWISVTTPSGYTGTAAMNTTPNTGANNNTGYAANSSRLDFQVNFVKTGTHYVWIRGYGASGNDDSIHAGLDGSEISTCDRISTFSTSYTWSKATMDGVDATFDVASTGVQTVNVWMREDGFVFDKIVLTTNINYTPTGNGPAESPRGGGSEPGQATNPSPSNAATDISITADLSWTSGSGSTSSDVYFGTSSPGTFQGNQTATTFDPGTLANDTTYYWRTDEVNTGGTTTGVVWSFTTETGPLVISNLWVLSGKAYEVVDAGLVVGSVQCIDRIYTFDSVPASFVGETYIKTAMDDKLNTGNNFLSFDVNQDVAVYVAHDDRITPKPTWLQSFVDTGDDLHLSAGVTYSLYRKDYPQGTVTLGGNGALDGNSAMYTVVVVGW